MSVEADEQAAANEAAGALVELEDGAARIAVGRASGVKCQRCWRYVPAVATTGEPEGLCDRGADAVGQGAGRASQIL